MSVRRLERILRFSLPRISINPWVWQKEYIPGRVTWAHDQAAVSFNPAGTNGFWWDDINTNPTKVADMLSCALKGTTGATNSDDAWDILFRYANTRRGKPDVGYSSGEKIAIKVNLVMGLAGGTDNATCPGPTPQLLKCHSDRSGCWNEYSRRQDHSV